MLRLDMLDKVERDGIVGTQIDTLRKPSYVDEKLLQVVNLQKRGRVSRRHNVAWIDYMTTQKTERMPTIDTPVRRD